MAEDRFMFSVHAADESERDLDLRCMALKQRMDKIVDNVRFAETPYGNNLPIIEHLLRLTPTAEEMEQLASALTRLAPIRTEYEKFKRQLDMIKMIQENPTEVAALFGEFGSDDLDPEMFNN